MSKRLGRSFLAWISGLLTMFTIADAGRGDWWGFWTGVWVAAAFFAWSLNK